MRRCRWHALVATTVVATAAVGGTAIAAFRQLPLPGASYRLIDGWPQAPAQYQWGAVVVDAADRLYIDDTLNAKIWILDAKSARVLGTVDGVGGHGMAVSMAGDHIYVTGSATGVRRYSRTDQSAR